MSKRKQQIDDSLTADIYKYTFGIIGMIFALIGVGTSVFLFFLPAAFFFWHSFWYSVISRDLSKREKERNRNQQRSHINMWELPYEKTSDTLTTTRTDSKKIEFHVAGVTFNNGKKPRQEILEDIYFMEPPFDDSVDVTFERTDFEGELAIAVYANKIQLGYVPKKIINELDEMWSGNYVAACNVIGGDDGKSYGCIIEAYFY